MVSGFQFSVSGFQLLLIGFQISVLENLHGQIESFF